MVLRSPSHLFMPYITLNIGYLISSSLFPLGFFHSPILSSVLAKYFIINRMLVQYHDNDTLSYSASPIFRYRQLRKKPHCAIGSMIFDYVSSALPKEYAVRRSAWTPIQLIVESTDKKVFELMQVLIGRKAHSSMISKSLIDCFSKTNSLRTISRFPMMMQECYTWNITKTTDLLSRVW